MEANVKQADIVGIVRPSCAGAGLCKRTPPYAKCVLLAALWKCHTEDLYGPTALAVFTLSIFLTLLLSDLMRLFL